VIPCKIQLNHHLKNNTHVLSHVLQVANKSVQTVPIVLTGPNNLPLFHFFHDLTLKRLLKLLRRYCKFPTCPPHSLYLSHTHPHTLSVTRTLSLSLSISLTRTHPTHTGWIPVQTGGADYGSSSVLGTIHQTESKHTSYRSCL
jgi:hypothetical protein